MVCWNSVVRRDDRCSNSDRDLDIPRDRVRVSREHNEKCRTVSEIDSYDAIHSIHWLVFERLVHSIAVALSIQRVPASDTSRSAQVTSDERLTVSASDPCNVAPEQRRMRDP